MAYTKLFAFGELFCSKTMAINSSLWDIVAGEASEFIHFIACIVVQGIKKGVYFIFFRYLKYTKHDLKVQEKVLYHSLATLLTCENEEKQQRQKRIFL